MESLTWIVHLKKNFRNFYGCTLDEERLADGVLASSGKFSKEERKI